MQWSSELQVPSSTISALLSESQVCILLLQVDIDIGISSLQKKFVLVMECMPLTINDRACNYFACKQNNEYLPVAYNGTSGAHHGCIENLCTSVFNDIGTITKPTAAV